MKKNQFLNKKSGICLLAAVVLFTAVRPFMASDAKEDSFVTFDKASKKDQVHVTLCLQESMEEVVTFQVGFHLEGEEIGDVKFAFADGIKNDVEIPVKEFRYDDASGDLTVYVSGRKTVLEKKALDLGKIQVDSEKNVEIQVNEGECKAVDRFHVSHEITEMGDLEGYTMELEALAPTEPPTESESEPPTEEETTAGPAPEEPTTGETKPEETTQGETRPEETRPEETTKGETSGVHDSSDDDSDSGVLSSPQETKGSWQKNGQEWRFKKLDGSYAVNEWAMINGKWYWFDETGRMKTGWTMTGGLWYYLSPSGEMKTGWVQDQNKWYYLAASGHMKTGWVEDNTGWYYLEPSGAMKTGWVEVDGKWYYFDQSGRMAANTDTPDGHHVDRNGVRDR